MVVRQLSGVRVTQNSRRNPNLLDEYTFLQPAVASAKLLLRQTLSLICLKTNLQNITIHMHGALFAQNCIVRRGLLLAILPLLYALASPSGLAQDTAGNGTRTHGQKTITAVRTTLPVTLDGNLDEPAWQEARISLGFVQKDPQEGEPSTERTEFRVLYTATTLYIGVICYDSNAEGILASERRRDNSLENDDTVWCKPRHRCRRDICVGLPGSCRPR